MEATAPRVVRALPGRARLHLPEWTGQGPDALAAGIRELPGVREARADRLTRNVLVRYDIAVVDEAALVAHVARVAASPAPADERAPPAAHEAKAPTRPVARRSGRRARIALHGLRHDPELARRAVERVEALDAVRRASASALTGRVFVELIDDGADLERVVSELGGLEELDLDPEPIPHHPLDPAPIVEGGARFIGAALGLTLLAGRQLTGRPRAPTRGAAAGNVAATLALTEALPPVSGFTERVLGHEGKALVLGGLSIVSLSLAGGHFGLMLAGVNGLRLLSEARARRSAWQEYERRVDGRRRTHPGVVMTVQAGDRVPLAARVLDGFGTTVARDGTPQPVTPGGRLDAGARLQGGPFEVELEGGPAFGPQPRPEPARASSDERYVASMVLPALAYAGVTALVTRSAARAFTALLLVNPRPAVVGAGAAELGASARLVRSGVTVVGARPGRRLHVPDTLFLTSARALTDGLELGGVAPMRAGWDEDRLRAVAAQLAAAADSPWGPAFAATRGEAGEGTFDGRVAGAEIDGERWLLEPVSDPAGEPDELHLQLRRQRDVEPVGVVVLRPRLAPGLRSLRRAARRANVRLLVVVAPDAPAARAVARRAGLAIEVGEPAAVVPREQLGGRLVAVVGDGACDAQALEAADMAIGLSSGRSGPFPAAADVLAPGLAAVAVVVKTAARRDAAARDAVRISMVSNAAGAWWALTRPPRFAGGGRLVTLTALATHAAAWARTRGGHAPPSVARRVSDPMPERWGRQTAQAVLRRLESRPAGLTHAEAVARWRPPRADGGRPGVLSAMAEQLRSPLVVMLAAGAGLSLAVGAVGDVALIGAVVVANAVVGWWQERQAGKALEALEALGAGVADVVRDGVVREVPTTDVVPGDVLVLAPGVRIAADARVLSADALEVDEAALTGESLPVRKDPDNGTDASRVVLEGSDVVTGTGRAVVVAVGDETRMGALAAALRGDTATRSKLDERLERIVRTGLPAIAGAAAVVVALGVARGQPLVPQLVLAASIAVAAVPEGLPLLAGAAEAGVARRLAGRRALVSRLSAVEALGRVDVACIDKTGTLTEGRLAVTVVAGATAGEARPPALGEPLREVLALAAIASPHPDAGDARSHPTDVAVLEAAEAAGLADRARVHRDDNAPFDPARSYHAARAGRRLHVKGAVEAVAPRCTRVLVAGTVRDLDDAGRQALLDRARELAERGLRVLLVADRSGGDVDDPRALTAIGFIGMGDPLRAAAPAALRRCMEAGVGVVMLTGDHPATAATIAREAGLPTDSDRVLTGADIAELPDRELRERLERATVIARTTPLDKLRIVEALQAAGHVVAMTGDGVNDAPALRLADVGVALGAHSTEVARQAADLVVATDDLSTLAEALVEGRSFWRNMRRSLGLLLGGNAGEVGLVIAAGAAGLPAPLTARQVLAVNLVTDVLPAIAVAVQPPEHRDLASLAREGDRALDRPLRDDILRRAVATGAPSFGAYALASRSRAGLPAARAVAYISIVTTQLAQTGRLGRADGGVSRSVVAAVAASLAVLTATVALPPVRSLLGLGLPGPGGLLLAGAATVAAAGLAEALHAGAAPAAALSAVR